MGPHLWLIFQNHRNHFASGLFEVGLPWNKASSSIPVAKRIWWRPHMGKGVALFSCAFCCLYLLQRPWCVSRCSYVEDMQVGACVLLLRKHSLWHPALGGWWISRELMLLSSCINSCRIPSAAGAVQLQGACQWQCSSQRKILICYPWRCFVSPMWDGPHAFRVYCVLVLEISSSRGSCVCY